MTPQRGLTRFNLTRTFAREDHTNLIQWRLCTKIGQSKRSHSHPAWCFISNHSFHSQLIVPQKLQLFPAVWFLLLSFVFVAMGMEFNFIPTSQWMKIFQHFMLLASDPTPVLLRDPKISTWVMRKANNVNLTNSTHRLTHCLFYV